MKIKPLGKRVIIEISERKTKSGIVLTNGEIDDVATIISVGDDVLEFKVGDKVLFDKFAGYNLENPMQRLIEEKDIFAKVED